MQSDISPTMDRAACAALDAADPLARFRADFLLPGDPIYLDGNSLGAMPKAAAARLRQVSEQEWATGLVKSWNSAGWFDLPTCLGNKLAPLIGAGAGEVIVCDSASVNLFKLICTAIVMRPDRRVIILEGSNFPTNNYIAQGVAAQTGGRVQVRFLEKDEIAAGIDADTAAVCVTHVHYKTGHLHDMAAITARAHEMGALAIWDVCHSAGALPVDLNGCDADFAVGCTYKYLNGGPGAPGFLFAAKRNHGGAHNPISGWWGHAAPFAFDRDYAAATDIRQFLTGTPPIISMALVECGLDVHLSADMAHIRAKSMALGALLVDLVERRCAEHGLTLASPREPDARGSQLSFAHPHAYAITQALIHYGVVGDFRAPDVIRFGFAPLYVRHVDIWDAVTCLARIMDEGLWQDPAFSARQAVT